MLEATKIRGTLRKRRQLEEVTKDEAQKLPLLGLAGGDTLFHCYSRHLSAYNGARETCYYRICERGEYPALDEEAPLIVAFYGYRINKLFEE